MNTEFEARFTNINEDKIKSLISKNGGRMLNHKNLIKRQTFDFPLGTIPLGQKKWVRVRHEVEKITITLKHIIDKTKIDGVKEIEIIANNFENAIELIKNLGLKNGPYQENYREAWEMNSCSLTIDTWPGLAPFLEIEGKNRESVESSVLLLGLNINNAKYGSIDLLYQEKYNINPIDFNKIERLDFSNYSSVL